jgi:hypothetical protein
VPEGLLFGTWAFVAILGAAYVLVGLRSFEPKAAVAPVEAPQAALAPFEVMPATSQSVALAAVQTAPASVVAPPAPLSGVTTANLVTTRLEMNAAEVDTQAFILEQAGLAPRASTAPMVMPSPVVDDSMLAPAGSAARFTTPSGRVELLLAEVDTQAYILAQAGEALRYELPPSAD